MSRDRSRLSRIASGGRRPFDARPLCRCAARRPRCGNRIDAEDTLVHHPRSIRPADTHQYIHGRSSGCGFRSVRLPDDKNGLAYSNPQYIELRKTHCRGHGTAGRRRGSNAGRYLPAKFGGGPTDYQLVEDTAGAEPRLRLLVRPSVGPLDLVKVAETFYETIGKGNGVERIAAEQWRQLNVLRVERAQLLTTPIGKVLHVHQSSPAVEL